MQMIIEFYTVNIFVKEALITSVGPDRAGLRNTWAATGRAEPEKMAQFRGLVYAVFWYIFKK